MDWGSVLHHDGKTGEKSATICWIQVSRVAHVKHVCASSGNHRDSVKEDNVFPLKISTSVRTASI